MSCFKKMTIGLVLANHIGASSNQMHDVKQLKTKKSIKQKGLKNGKLPKLSFEKDKPKKSDALRSQLDEVNDELVKDKEQSARNLLKVPGRARHSDTRCEKEKFKDQLKALKAQISALRGKKTCWQMNANFVIGGYSASDFNGIWYQPKGFDWLWLKDDCVNGQGCTMVSDDGELDIAAHTHSGSHVDRNDNNIVHFYDYQEVAECEYMKDQGIYDIADAIAYCFDGSHVWTYPHATGPNPGPDPVYPDVMKVSFKKVVCPGA